MAELVGGAALGALFGELLNLVIRRGKQTIKFDKELVSLEKTLKHIEPIFTKITDLNNRPVEERTALSRLLEEGKELVVKCTKISSMNLIKKHQYSAKLTDLNNNLLKIFHIEAVGGIMTGILASADRGRPFRPCNVPGISDFTIGLDQHVLALKRMLIEEHNQLLVVSGPGGGGKTTLAKKFCHDDYIKGIFGENIIYVTVSKETSLKNIAQDLFKHYDIKNYVLKSEEDAKNQIENLLRQKASVNRLLLVLDDVWSASVIRDLKFQIPGYKMLVTSRDLFREFNSTYNLSLLNAKDAETLFCHHAFPSGRNSANNVSENLVNKMVQVCNGLPLALTVVGASLCNQLEVKWRSTLKKWSEGQSILKSHEKLLECLETSIDALDEVNHENVKECFLDFGLFPEDGQIAGTALLDMWIELYNLGDDTASLNLLHIASRNLINLVSVRKVTGEMDGHCSQYHVMQHDVLRELAIHLITQEPEANRRRLFMETHGDNFPKWWTKQPLDARILSVSIDGELSSTWDDLDAPNVEVLILNIRSENCSLPRFIKKMSQLKVLIVTGYGGYPTQLENLEFLASLSKLSRIRFEHVSVSSSIQVVFALKTLKKLTFVMCKIGDAFNIGDYKYPYMLENLKDVEFDYCYDLKELPAGLCSSVHLRKLIVTNCQELDSLPKELGNLSNLEILGLHCCTKLKELPESIGSLCKLSAIDISYCSHINALPKPFGKLRSLRLIDISGCDGLEKLPDSLAELKRLEAVICDEERSYLWKVIASDRADVKINLVQEDRFGTLKKIFSNLFSS